MPVDCTSIPELEYLTLRVLEEYAEDEQAWVATCLDTGAVASAPDLAMLEKLIEETIQLEITMAVQRSDFANLFRKPAAGEVVARWLRAAGLSGGLTEVRLGITIDLATPPRREVKSEIGIKKASVPRTA